MNTLKKTPLHAEHLKLKARMVDFGGWHMPVQYSTVIDEHKAVRTAVGLFDVSHMGEINVHGRGALEFLQKMVTNDISKMSVGQAQYSALCYDNGTLVDDIIVYRRGADSFFICVNASNVDKDFAWFKEHCPAQGVILENLSDEYGQIAIQGPKARELLQDVVDIKVDGIKYYHFSEGKVFGIPSIIARTGYTGELGYELYVPASAAAKVWERVLEAGQKYGIKPCGLGARDTLRLEVAYLLYGNDMDNTTTALECGLGWVTKFDKGDFIGRSVLADQKEKGVNRKLVGIELIDKAIGRQGHEIFSEAEGGEKLGVVTSGTVGPSIEKNIALGYVDTKHADLGNKVYIDVRGTRKLAQIVKRPFYTAGTVQK